MAYLNKKIVKSFVDRIKEGWEPSFRDIKVEYFSKDRMDITRINMLSRSLIMRARKMLKKEGLFFYFHRGTNKYIILDKPLDRLDVDRELWNKTKGYANSVNRILVDTIQTYPELTVPFLEFKTGLSLIQGLIKDMSLKLQSGITEIGDDQNGH